jgi:hypothetical protein
MRTAWPSIAGLAGALSQTSRSFFIIWIARGSASLSCAKSRPLSSFIGSQFGGTSSSHLISRKPLLGAGVAAGAVAGRGAGLLPPSGGDSVGTPWGAWARQAPAARARASKVGVRKRRSGIAVRAQVGGDNPSARDSR